MKIESKPKKVKEYMIKIKLSEEEAKLLSGIEFKLKDVPTTYSHTWFSQMPFGSSVKADWRDDT